MEHFDKRIAFGMFCIVLGGIILSWQGVFNIKNITGNLFIVGACICWAIDNNFTRKISANDPIQLASIKSLSAGSINIGIACLISSQSILFKKVLLTSVIGFVGYGSSLLLFILALRNIGTARTGAYFSIAPFVGVLIAILFFGEHLSLQIICASILMGIGIWLHLTEKHNHEHEHNGIKHSHEHFPDIEHQHKH